MDPVFFHVAKACNMLTVHLGRYNRRLIKAGSINLPLCTGILYYDRPGRFVWFSMWNHWWQMRQLLFHFRETHRLIETKRPYLWSWQN